MILGLGCDIVKVSRFNKGTLFLTRFVKKHLTLKEATEIREKTLNLGEDDFILAVATRFAAKEAVAKALGSGFRFGITLQDIEIIHDELGCPQVTLYNQALNRGYTISNNQQFKVYLTMSDEKEYANAVAVIESI